MEKKSKAQLSKEWRDNNPDKVLAYKTKKPNMIRLTEKRTKKK